MLRRRLLILAVAVLVAPFAPAAPVDAVDGPNTCSSSIAPSSHNTWHRGTIASSGDVDWYRFSLTSGRYTFVTLGDLGANYRIDLYAACGSPAIRFSDRRGTEYEEIAASLGAGSYYVRISSPSGATSGVIYSLRFRPIPPGMRILSYTSWVDGSGYLHLAGEVFNNTSERRRWVELNATLRNSAGSTIGSAVGYAEALLMQPRSRSPFEIITRRPTGYHHSSVSVLSRATTALPVTGLTVSAGTPYADGGRWHFMGSVRNGYGSTVNLAQVLVTLYDARGGVAGLATSWTNPARVADGSTASFDAHAPGAVAFNRAAYQAQASRSGCYAGHASTAPVTGSYDDYAGAIPNAGNRVALTFDMGGRMTPAVSIIEFLIENRVCATIFPTGRQARDSTEGRRVMALIRAHPELFELGNHTMHHCNLAYGGGGSPSSTDTAYCARAGSNPSTAFIQDELLDSDAILRGATGMNVKPYWRAPYGSYDSGVLSAAAGAGYRVHFRWDVDTIDWRPISQGGPTARSMALKVVDNAKPGSDVLMHLGGYETRDALHAMIRGLRSRGYVLTTLSDMLD